MAMHFLQRMSYVVDNNNIIRFLQFSISFGGYDSHKPNHDSRISLISSFSFSSRKTQHLNVLIRGRTLQ